MRLFHKSRKGQGTRQARPVYEPGLGRSVLKGLALRIAFLLAALLFGWQSRPVLAQGEMEVDLELVLAIDASGSVDAREYALQMQGIAYALRNPAVLEAIASGYHWRIAIAVAVWAESQMPKDTTGWYLIDDARSAEALARVVEIHPRRVKGGTGIGRAISYAVDLIDDNGFTSNRRVIDISGDGRETTFRYWSVPPNQARIKARSRAVTINGLVILADDPELDHYYRTNVIIGPGSFVMKISSFNDFSKAMSEKFLREIEFRPNLGFLPAIR
jgi:hypothetical protein